MDWTKYKYYQGCIFGRLHTIQVVAGAFITKDMYAAGQVCDLLNARGDNAHWMVGGDPAKGYFIYNNLIDGQS